MGRANALVICVVATPLVWLLGYQEHRWRSTELASLAAMLLLAASALLVHAARSEHPPDRATAEWAAVGVSTAALLMAAFWGIESFL